MDLISPMASAPQPQAGEQSESSHHMKARLQGEVASERTRHAVRSGEGSAELPLTVEELSHQRSSFSILIHGQSRIAWNLLALLYGAGFDEVAIISHGVKFPSRIAVEEFTALAITSAEIGLERGVVTEGIRARSGLHRIISERGHGKYPPSLPSLIISLQIPLHDYRQRWMSESTPHLIVETRAGTTWIGPYVLPGITPCIQCFLLHERDGAGGQQAKLIKFGALNEVDENETSVAAAALAAAVIATEVSSLVTDKASSLIGGRVAINLLEPTLHIRVEESDHSQPEPSTLPRWRTFEFHPECGCVGGQLSS